MGGMGMETRDSRIRSSLRDILLRTVIGGFAVGIVLSAGAAPATRRPISDFVSAQGTFCIDDGGGGCILFVPPVRNYIGWSDLKHNLCISVDYAGVANDWIEGASSGAISFGTETSGSISERTLADGRAEVSVRLHTRNALMYVVDGCEDFGTNPLFLGNRGADILAGWGEAALGESHLQVRFINTAPGAPLPDLLQLIIAPEPGQEFPSFLAFTARGDGKLHANFGVPEGTAGRVEVTETGLFMTAFKGATADGFPVEQIILRAVGH